jgi:hypothetical protein
MAAVPNVRRPLLHLSGVAGPQVEEGFAVRTELHPRVYTDPTSTTPIAVPALIRRWWPMVFLLVFKAPPKGGVHVFGAGEPFAQILILPEETAFDLVPMSDDEAAEREMQSRRVYVSRATLSAETEWTSATKQFSTGPIAAFWAPPTRERSSRGAAAEDLFAAPADGPSLLRQRNYYLVVVVMMMVVMMAVMVMMVMVIVVLRHLERLIARPLVLGLQHAGGVRDGIEQFGEGTRWLQPIWLRGRGS